MKNASVVLLTLDEIDGCRAILPSLPRDHIGELLAVDGRSTDGTVEYLESLGIRCIGQDRPGRAEAFRVGVKAARFDRIVFFSPDGNEDPGDIQKLLDLLDDGAAMAIASRFLPGGRNEEDEARLPMRAWANRTFTAMANLAFNRGKFVTDTINGFRALSRPVFNVLDPDGPGYVVEYLLSIRAFRHGLEVREIPTIEGNRIGGRSKARSLPTGLLFLRYFLRELFCPPPLNRKMRRRS